MEGRDRGSEVARGSFALPHSRHPEGRKSGVLARPQARRPRLFNLLLIARKLVQEAVRAHVSRGLRMQIALLARQLAFPAYRKFGPLESQGLGSSTGTTAEFCVSSRN